MQPITIKRKAFKSTSGSNAITLRESFASLIMGKVTFMSFFLFDSPYYPTQGG